MGSSFAFTTEMAPSPYARFRIYDLILAVDDKRLGRSTVFLWLQPSEGPRGDRADQKCGDDEPGDDRDTPCGQKDTSNDKANGP